jgi:hypothetical protein
MASSVGCCATTHFGEPSHDRLSLHRPDDHRRDVFPDLGLSAELWTTARCCGSPQGAAILIL